MIHESLSINFSGKGLAWILERFGFHEVLAGPCGLMIMAIGFSSGFILSFEPAATLYLFQLYRRMMLRGNDRAAPPPGHSFIGGALANSIGESRVFPCRCPTNPDTRYVKPSLYHTHCFLHRQFYNPLVNLDKCDQSEALKVPKELKGQATWRAERGSWAFRGQLQDPNLSSH